MGCLFSFFFRPSASADIVETPRQVFSWEREDRKAIRIEDFILDKLIDQTVIRLPGAVNGQQFIIQNCENCNVFVFDHTGQVQIDDCKNCRIFIGPVRGSIFIRDSTGCTLATICQQFRTRDCHDINVFLSCISQPIIESSHNIKFACLTLNYEQLSSQYQAGGISPWNNNWGNIHDFTKIPDTTNFSLLDENENLLKYLQIPNDPSISHLNITDDRDSSFTPYSYGELFRKRTGERCFVIAFHHQDADSFARALIAANRQSAINFVQSKLYQIDESSAERLFNGNKSYNALIRQGPILGLEFVGDNAVQLCQQTVHNLVTTKFSSIPHFVSQTAADAQEQIDKFYNFASMQMFA